MAYALVRWRFDDPSTLEAHTFTINPNEGGSPTHQKKFEYQSTAAPDGKTIIFEGRDEPQKLEFSGQVFEQEDHDALVTWFEKRNQIKVTDDLGRSFFIVIEQLDLTRKRSSLFPWRHDYKVQATIVDWVTA